MNKYQIKIFLLVFLIILVSLPVLSQDNSKISPYLDLQYFKNTDDQAYLQSTLTYSMNRMVMPLTGMTIYFSGNSGYPAGSSVTDEKGIARLVLESDKKLTSDADGFMSFISEFKGNDTIDIAVAEITVKDLNLEMNLSMGDDSIRNIIFKAYTRINGSRIPVTDELIMVYVSRMFSLLPVAEATLDETGTSVVEFPADIPGDKDGNLTIIAKLEENPTYGNIERKVTEKWGIPTSYSVPETHRALWTKTPPMWMIVTLSILLAGVWGHYFFAILSLILIRIDAKRKKAKEEYKDKD